MKCRKRGCLFQKAILIILRSVPLGVISGICLCITGRQRGAVSNQTRFSWVCDATRATRTARPEPGHRQPGQQRAPTSGGRGPSLPPQGGRRWPWPPSSEASATAPQERSRHPGCSQPPAPRLSPPLRHCSAPAAAGLVGAPETPRTEGDPSPRGRSLKGSPE